MATARPTSSQPGDKMPDGTIYAGVSPETGKKLWAYPFDNPLTLSFNEAREDARYKSEMGAFGHSDWRLPTKGELNVLFNNRAAIERFLIGEFDLSGSNSSGCYWSASFYDKWNAWGQRFSDGRQGYADREERLSVRLVRTGP